MTSITNRYRTDSYHAELAGADLHSPIAILQKSHLMTLLQDFFDKPRKVLDFGCGEASLLVELAGAFPSFNVLWI